MILNNKKVFLKIWIYSKNSRYPIFMSLTYIWLKMSRNLNLEMSLLRFI